MGWSEVQKRDVPNLLLAFFIDRRELDADLIALDVRDYALDLEEK